MLPLLERLKTWWTTAERNQRVVTLGGIGALVLLLVGTILFVTRPHYAILADNLTDAQQGRIVDTLTTEGIPVQYSRRGVVEVPEEMVVKAHLKLAATNDLPSGTIHHQGLDDLKPNFTDPPEVQAARLKAIMEGDIARTLEMMEGVASAQVLLSLPEQRIFTRDKEAPSASVTLVEDGQGALTQENGRTIANLVCASVPGMKLDGVVVVSSTLGDLWNGKDGGGGDKKLGLQNQVAREWKGEIQRALEEAFGIGSARVIVRADVNTDVRHIREQKVTPSQKPSAVQSRKETMDRNGRVASGVSGAASNTQNAPATPPNGGDGKGNYQSSDDTRLYKDNLLETTTDVGTGALEGLAITVVANSNVIADDSAVKTIVDGALKNLIKTDVNGVPLLNQRFTTTVTSVKFSDAAAKVAKDASAQAATQQRIQQILSLLPIGVILIIALLVAKQVGKISKSILPTPPVADGTLAEEPGILPTLDGPDALPAPSGAAVATLDEEPIALEQFKAQVDVPLESLKQMAAERPEMVATLIKSVMLGERG